MSNTLRGIGARKSCPTCQQPLNAYGYDPEEEPTGRSNITMRLYGEWVARFDRYSDEQRTELLDLLTTYESHTRNEQLTVVKAFTGEGIKKFFDQRRSAARLPK